MSAEKDYHYAGTELDAFSCARLWKRYWWGQISQFVGRDILEVGAGCGNNIEWFDRKPGVRYTGVEPDGKLAGVLKSRLDRTAFESSTVVTGFSGDLPSGNRFDTVVYLDVLEHIEDDRRELRTALDLLQVGGHLIILAPAYPWLYSAFDRSVGHCRRYDIPALRRVMPEGLVEVRVRYLDAMGLLASLAMKIGSRSGTASKFGVTLWDRLLVPLSRCLDPVTGYGIGRSLLFIARKESRPGEGLS